MITPMASPSVGTHKSYCVCSFLYNNADDNARQVSVLWNLMVLLCLYNNAGNNARQASRYWNLMVLLYWTAFDTIAPTMTPIGLRILEFGGLIVFYLFSYNNADDNVKYIPLFGTSRASLLFNKKKNKALIGLILNLQSFHSFQWHQHHLF